MSTNDEGSDFPIEPVPASWIDHDLPVYRPISIVSIDRDSVGDQDIEAQGEEAPTKIDCTVRFDMGLMPLISLGANNTHAVRPYLLFQCEPDVLIQPKHLLLLTLESGGPEEKPETFSLKVKDDPTNFVITATLYFVRPINSKSTPPRPAGTDQSST